MIAADLRPVIERSPGYVSDLFMDVWEEKTPIVKVKEFADYLCLRSMIFKAFFVELLKEREPEIRHFLA